MNTADSLQNTNAGSRDDLLPTEDAAGRRTGASSAQLNQQVRESDIARQSAQPASLERGDATSTTAGLRDKPRKDMDAGGADVRELQTGSGKDDVNDLNAGASRQDDLQTKH
jgi:hypothetical protein